MKYNIDAIREEAEGLLYELNTKAHFEEFASGHIAFYDWLNKYRKDIPSFIKISSGCTRFVFWDVNKSDYVFKMNIYVDDIDYGRQEEYIYNKAKETHIEQCFAWVYKVIENGARSIYAMDFCDVDSHKLSSESWEYQARKFCDNEGWDFDNLTSEQREEINCWTDDSDYSGTEGMMDFAGEVFDWDTYHALCEFISDCNLNDLHAGNWGYHNGNLVIVDYAGYERNLIPKVA